MAHCEYCEIINGQRKAVKIYEDDKVLALLADKPAALGHMIMLPKNHYPIIEQVPDYIVSHIFAVANKLSISAFEGMNALGTNILVNNGVAAGQTSSHFMVHIIPRKEGDNINLSWPAKQLGEEQLSTIMMQIKEHTEGIGEFEKEKQEPIKIERDKTIAIEDFKVKCLDRIP
ncbi:HIT domain-containing protein [Candidatus Woesearchaeota archaeon]|nr:HIT domain-containing protein [Candidatus Woesearchaeota archaeon]